MIVRHVAAYLVLTAALLTGACRRDPGPAAAAPRPVGVTSDLLDADLGNCRVPEGGWSYADGILTWLDSRGDVWTRAAYGDFVLELDWKIAPGTNSGVIFRCAEPNDWMHTGLEVQIHGDGDGSKHGQVGAIYDLVSPAAYRNARLVATGADGPRWVAPVPGTTLDLGLRGSVTIKKVFTNLKLMERQGRTLPYNASGDSAENPALLCDWTRGAQTQALIVYPDGTRDGPCPPDTRLAYETGHWLPDQDVRRPVGAWNHLRLRAEGPIVQVDLNGSRIVDLDLDTYTEAGHNPQGTRNKYPVAGRDLPRRGFIALQDHGKPVWFRNIRITPLR